MKCDFVWQTGLTADIQAVAETKIREDLSSVHSPIHLCHNGLCLVTLSSPDPFQQSIVGNVKCSCGKPVGIVQGTRDAAHLELTAVPP